MEIVLHVIYRTGEKNSRRVGMIFRGAGFKGVKLPQIIIPYTQ